MFNYDILIVSILSGFLISARMECVLTADYWGDPDGIEPESLDVVQSVLHPLPRPATVIAQVCAGISAAIRPRESIGENLVANHNPVCQSYGKNTRFSATMVVVGGRGKREKSHSYRKEEWLVENILRETYKIDRPRLPSFAIRG